MEIEVLAFFAVSALGLSVYTAIKLFFYDTIAEATEVRGLKLDVERLKVKIYGQPDAIHQDEWTPGLTNRVSELSHKLDKMQDDCSELKLAKMIDGIMEIKHDK